MKILVLNAGSSSLKFEVFDSSGWQRLLQGNVERFGEHAAISTTTESGKTKKEAPLHDIQAALEYVMNEAIGSTHDIAAAGHRVVHGGEFFSESVLVSGKVKDGIRQCAELAPLHNQANLEGIEAVEKILGAQVPQVAVFDTAFHQTLAPEAFLYALPYDLYQRLKARRYGFHGTSYRYVSHRYQEIRGAKEERTHLVILHLGNGCSVCAIKDGKSVDTSMGLTPLEGLVMGTRSGDVDPSVIEFLTRKDGTKVDDIDTILNKHSGLLGITAKTSDMRDLLEQESQGSEQAKLAIDMFCYRARKYIGSYLAALGGAEAIVFTGGIGENSWQVRERICQDLAWLGIRIDGNANRAAVGKEQEITEAGSAVRVHVIPTNEELVIAQDTERLVRSQT